MTHPPYDAIHWYIEELTAGIVAKTGIPSDRYHVGKIILSGLKVLPDHILQIDGATDERDTFQSALERSTRCATAFRNLGLRYQDVIVVMAPNHINLVIPMYAALYLGIKVAGIDMTLGVNELKDTFECCVPKVVFCQSSKVQTVQQALNLINMSAQIIAFDEVKHSEDCLSFSKFLDAYGEDLSAEDFKPAEFDPTKTIAILTPTSGSTGLPKTAAISHKNIMMGFPTVLNCRTKFPIPLDLALIVSPVQWLSAIFSFLMAPIVGYSRLQTSSATTPEHVTALINKYRPDFTVMSPTFLTTLLHHSDTNEEKCDFSCFRLFMCGGSAVAKELVETMQKRNPKMCFKVGYGMTEMAGFILDPGYAPFGSVGRPMSLAQYRLVDPTTGKDINEPNVPGELRLKGPTVFQGYYNNPEMTAAAFDEDGWLKSGDILYRDEYHNYYFYDRIKLLLKYRNHQVSPLEIESVIVTHPGVLDAAVTGVPDAECGDLPVALVVRRDGHHVTAQEIKQLVKESLTDSKQLRGGVVFVKELPLTSTSKLDRTKLKELAKTLKRE